METYTLAFPPHEAAILPSGGWLVSDAAAPRNGSPWLRGGRFAVVKPGIGVHQINAGERGTAVFSPRKNCYAVITASKIMWQENNEMRRDECQPVGPSGHCASDLFVECCRLVGLTAKMMVLAKGRHRHGGYRDSSRDGFLAMSMIPEATIEAALEATRNKHGLFMMRPSTNATAIVRPPGWDKVASGWPSCDGLTAIAFGDKNAIAVLDNPLL